MSGRLTGVAALAALLVVACAPTVTERSGPTAPSSRVETTPTSSSTPTPGSRPSPSSTSSPGTPEPAVTPTPSPSRRLVSDGEPRDAVLTIEALDVVDLAVETYQGSPDDAPGTEIQDGGIAASPHGEDGGTGVGGIGNYIVTAHRLSSTQAFLELPDLDEGDQVLLEADGRRYTYEITGTRETSFRSEESLAEQSAPVPGEPGEEPTEAMITLSTCATPEDDAEGNYWRDEFGNPEHRIDKVGVLVQVEDTR